MGRRQTDTPKAISMTKNVEMKRKQSKMKFFSNYSEVDVKNALQEIRDGTSIATASNIHNVPRTTLRNKLSGRAPETSGRVGRECVLGHGIEEKLEQWLLKTSKMGFPVNKDCLVYSVHELMKRENISNPFKNGCPGRKWFDAFLKRHPRIAHKKLNSPLKPGLY